MRRPVLQFLDIAVGNPIRPVAVAINGQIAPGAVLRRDICSEFALPGIQVGDTQFARSHQIAEAADVHILGHRSDHRPGNDCHVVGPVDLHGNRTPCPVCGLARLTVGIGLTGNELVVSSIRRIRPVPLRIEAERAVALASRHIALHFEFGRAIDIRDRQFPTGTQYRIGFLHCPACIATNHCRIVDRGDGDVQGAGCRQRTVGHSVGDRRHRAVPVLDRREIVVAVRKDEQGSDAVDRKRPRIRPHVRLIELIGRAVDLNLTDFQTRISIRIAIVVQHIPGPGIAGWNEILVHRLAVRYRFWRFVDVRHRDRDRLARRQATGIRCHHVEAVAALRLVIRRRPERHLAVRADSELACICPRQAPRHRITRIRIGRGRRVDHRAGG